MSDLGTGTVRYCPNGPVVATCDCATANPLDVSVAAAGSSDSVSVGGTVTYTATITNHAVGLTATGAALAITPSAGVQLTTFATSAGACDAAVNLCSLSSIGAGQSVTVTVTATLPTAGIWPVTFSVTHKDSDPIPSNDGATVVTLVQ